ncbi:hypothetical protein [Caulobacter sp. UNC358MFTsu5.1]|uniref:hypothetical protein n=1 Tax=Caulobacter sp. UNC358MFTsu5.1 TaxID=1449049 RepID=UPI0004A7319B|nr:hypothetical protein [Caulobacter sp. UNC358MFTsu5.1]
MERERLRALIRKLPGGPDLQIVFGEADDGAPWCAIIKQAGEVLVRVARLPSELVVHVTGQQVVT